MIKSLVIKIFTSVLFLIFPLGCIQMGKDMEFEKQIYQIPPPISNMVIENVHIPLDELGQPLEIRWDNQVKLLRFSFKLIPFDLDSYTFDYNNITEITSSLPSLPVGSNIRQLTLPQDTAPGYYFIFADFVFNYENPIFDGNHRIQVNRPYWYNQIFISIEEPPPPQINEDHHGIIPHNKIDPILWSVAHSYAPLIIDSGLDRKNIPQSIPLMLQNSILLGKTTPESPLMVYNFEESRLDNYEEIKKQIQNQPGNSMKRSHYIIHNYDSKTILATINFTELFSEYYHHELDHWVSHCSIVPVDTQFRIIKQWNEDQRLDDQETFIHIDNYFCFYHYPRGQDTDFFLSQETYILQYWFYYRYEEHHSLCDMNGYISHRGNWKNLTLVLNADFSVRKILFSGHTAGEMQTLSYQDPLLREADYVDNPRIGWYYGHPVVYTAVGNNAFYSRKGEVILHFYAFSWLRAYYVYILLGIFLVFLPFHKRITLLLKESVLKLKPKSKAQPQSHNKTILEKSKQKPGPFRWILFITGVLFIVIGVFLALRPISTDIMGETFYYKAWNENIPFNGENLISLEQFSWAYFPGLWHQGDLGPFEYNKANSIFKFYQDPLNYFVNDQEQTRIWFFNQ